MRPRPRLAVGVALALGCVLVPAAALIAQPSAPPNPAKPRPDLRPHVVIVVLDELPGDNLLGPDGRIDTVRYPSFARLARRAHWFPNASTWSTSTKGGVPAILDGRQPRRGAPATRRAHPVSLYDAMARAGYRIVDGEETSTLCPRRLCARSAIPSPPCGNLGCRFRGPGRVARFNRWLATIRPTRRPTFWVKHLLFPHRPWIYLPSGRRIQDSRSGHSPIEGLNRLGGPPDEFLRLHHLQRHLLQLRFTDRLIGRLLDRLARRGMFDRTMLVVTSDHGYSFTGALREHRRLRPVNVHQIAPIPLLVKLPNQRVGQRHDTYAANADVTPTVAAVAGARLGYVPDAAPLFGEAVRARQSVALADRVGVSLFDYQQQRAAWRERRLRLFGYGRHGFWDGIGPNPELVGRRVAGLPRRAAGPLLAEFVSPERLHSVRRASGLVPAQVTGHLRHGPHRGHHDLALALNGRIAAVGRSFYLPGDPTEHFAMTVPPHTLREGVNRVRLYDVRGRKLRLAGAI